MRLAWRELTRSPRAFIAPMGILLLLALLLLYPNAILDGIVQESTAAFRNAPADLIVYSRDANGVILRSRLDEAARQRVTEIPGVAKLATLDVAVLTGKVSGRDEPVGFALLSSDQAIGLSVPEPRQAIADESLQEKGVRKGSIVTVGPFRMPVTVTGFTSGTNLWFSGGLILDKTTWQAAVGQQASQPGQPAASQALLVTLESGADKDKVATAIDEHSAQATQTMTVEDAISAMPGMRQQESTFGYIRAVTLAVALVVVGLYMFFVTLQRAPLYAVLKALGGSTRQLFSSMLTQLLWISDIAVLAAALATWGLTFIPLELPAELTLTRVIETFIALRTAATLGAAASLRRVIRIDPAGAIG